MAHMGVTITAMSQVEVILHRGLGFRGYRTIIVRI